VACRVIEDVSAYTLGFPVKARGDLWMVGYGQQVYGGVAGIWSECCCIFGAFAMRAVSMALPVESLEWSILLA
jgi:hypothetical protein